ncbi:Tyrosine-tRNA ligase [Zancudomyces culisetae]|uniref:Tyrosine--tRNA ligase n=1 Tax=Zancudomyces culisetae TaxID=1213189 RepID=A0A1R1PXQ6_ZANCU|nr:Tyrosine-tRNA ligase [Zancudomyces culisetae]|eukprot:OMH85751.1 Tyrosine-tRNA ligase [Zancudomyces culisetae]
MHLGNLVALMGLIHFHLGGHQVISLIQIGGSDQWGNITAGIELIHKLNTLEEKKSIPNEGEPKRVRHENAFGLTIPLLTTSSGLKFGKSAGNAVWLDSNLTSPYELYQFFMKTSDQDIARYLPIFTLLSLEKINEIVTEHNKNPEKMLGQTVLASEVTELVHGSNEVKLAQELTAFFFGMKKGQNISDSNITSEYILKSFKNDSRLIRAKAEVIREMRITDLAVLTGACSSKSEAFRLIKNNGLYWNNTRVTSDKWMPSLDADYLDNGKFAIIRKGKTDFFILSVF